MDFAEFIDHYGAPAISSVTGVDVTLVAVWKSRNHIPRDRWPELLTGLRGLKISRLLALESASKERA